MPFPGFLSSGVPLNVFPALYFLQVRAGKAPFIKSDFQSPSYSIRNQLLWKEDFLIGFVAAAWITGKLCWKRPGGGVAWRLFSAFWGMMAYYLCGMVYFYVISNYVIHMPVSWKLVVINCFLITAAEDFILCVMAAVVARRLMPFALGQYR